MCVCVIHPFAKSNISLAFYNNFNAHLRYIFLVLFALKHHLNSLSQWKCNGYYLIRYRFKMCRHLWWNGYSCLASWIFHSQCDTEAFILIPGTEHGNGPRTVASTELSVMLCDRQTNLSRSFSLISTHSFRGVSRCACTLRAQRTADMPTEEKQPKTILFKDISI